MPDEKPLDVLTGKRLSTDQVLETALIEALRSINDQIRLVHTSTTDLWKEFRIIDKRLMGIEMQRTDAAIAGVVEKLDIVVRDIDSVMDRMNSRVSNLELTGARLDWIHVAIKAVWISVLGAIGVAIVGYFYTKGSH